MSGAKTHLPEFIKNESELEEILSRPSPDLVNMMKRLEGDIMFLGVSGKIGPGLARTAIRAVEAAGVNKELFGVDLFLEEGSKAALESLDMELIECDLLEPDQVARLPYAKNVIYLVGKKFGTKGSEGLTWMINVIAPANAARHFSRSRLVAFSTGCVYPMVDNSRGGCTEDSPFGPVGEYAQSCLGRERVFSFYSRANNIPISLIRLSYAVDLRYGVLYDIGRQVMENRPIDLKMSYFNTIWQGDVNNLTLLTLEHCASPPAVWNITRPEIVSIRLVAEEFAKIMGKKVVFAGEPGHRYFLSDTSKAVKAFGPPSVSLEKLIYWQARWLLSGGRSLNKPTHFEESEGDY
jgi:nucleoside-diphosphate-sugar epimerase